MSEQSAYDILRRVNPANIEARLYDTIHLCPDLTDTLLSTVDVPMKIVDDTKANGKFVACEFNRDIDSHRSPLSNEYFPPLADGQAIPKRLRDIEIKANQAFNAYRHLYFCGGICSVYLWDIDEHVIGFGVFIKNEIDQTLRTGQKIQGCIDCSDVVEIEETSGSATYTLTSSVLMNVDLEIGLSQPLKISGSTASQKSQKKAWKTDDDHIINVGQLVESSSSQFRDKIENIYVSKMKEIVDLIAKSNASANQAAVANELAALFAKRQKA